MISTRQDLLPMLQAAHLEYQLHEHPAVFTADEAAKYCAHIKGAHVKNLFLRNQKKTEYWLVTVSDEKRVDLSALGKLFNAKLSFASHDDLRAMLGVEPGSVTPLAILNDKQSRVKLIFDENIIAEEFINIHPMENTSTITIKLSDLRHFIETIHHKKIESMEVPERNE